jgi:hypothetical protein
VSEYRLPKPQHPSSSIPIAELCIGRLHWLKPRTRPQEGSLLPLLRISEILAVSDLLSLKESPPVLNVREIGTWGRIGTSYSKFTFVINLKIIVILYEPVSYLEFSLFCKTNCANLLDRGIPILKTLIPPEAFAKLDAAQVDPNRL